MRESIYIDNDKSKRNEMSCDFMCGREWEWEWNWRGEKKEEYVCVHEKMMIFLNFIQWTSEIASPWSYAAFSLAPD